jgi:hypothetical protein
MSKTRFIVFIFIVTSVFTSCNKKIEPDIRDVFVGTYNVTETWTENGKPVSKPAFSMSIEKATQNSSMVLLNNFANYGAGITVEAIVSGYFLTISQQTLPNLKAITGTGKTDSITITITYTENYNGTSIEISATAKKR